MRAAGERVVIGSRPFCKARADESGEVAGRVLVACPELHFHGARIPLREVEDDKRRPELDGDCDRSRVRQTRCHERPSQESPRTTSSAYSLGTDTDVNGSKTMDVLPHSLQTRCDLYCPANASATCEALRMR